MRIWVCSILLLLSCSSNDELRRVCPHECIPNQDEMSEVSLNNLREKMGVGQCSYGRGVCADADKEGVITECEGFVGPDLEVCDNIDNDCDGVTDEIPPRQSRYFPSYEVPPETLNPCIEEYGSLLGECEGILVECVGGQFVCNASEDWMAVEQGEDETLCDGKDNDCDGRVDEDLIKGLCFDDDLWKATNGACKAGIEVCVNAEFVCEGQILPSIELCDRIDNDCNGIVDDTGDTLDEQYDIVFIIDTSGSMCGYINAVAAALDAYVEQFEGNTNFRFAIVIMSTQGADLITVDTDFTDLGTIRSRLLTMGCSGSGIEGSLDSMKQVCEDVNPLALSWDSGANRLIFVFTDEPDQTYTTPATTRQDVVDACLITGTLPFIWHRGDPDFTWITGNANGLDFQLSNTWEPIFDDLNSIVITLCGSRTS